MYWRKNIACPSTFGRLIDFSVSPLVSLSDEGQEDYEMNINSISRGQDESTMQNYRLWTLWDRAEDSIQFITLVLEDSNETCQDNRLVESYFYQWTGCQSATIPPLSQISLQCLAQNIERVCIDLIMKPGYIPLPVLVETVEYPIESSSDPSGIIITRQSIVSFIYQNLLPSNGSSFLSRESNESRATIFYRLLHQIETIYREWATSTGLQTDWGYGVVGVYKKGSLALGLIRPCDSSEIISDVQFQSSLYFSGFVTMNSLEGFTPDMSSKTFLFVEKVCGKVWALLSPAALEILEKELVFGLDGYLEASIDEYTAHIYDMVVPSDEMENNWENIRNQLLCHVQQLGGKAELEKIVDFLVKSYQHPDYSILDDEEESGDQHGDLAQLNDMVLLLIIKTATSVIQKRREIIRMVFFSLCLIRHVCPEYAISRELFMRLQSLVCCYWRLDWLCYQRIESTEPRLGRLDLSGKGQESQEEQSILEVIIQSKIRFNSDEFIVSPSSAIGSAIQTIFSFIGFSRAHPLTSLKEASPIVKLIDSFFDRLPASSILDFLLSVPFPTPAVTFLKAKAWLFLEDYQKSRWFFERAIGNEGGESDLQLVVGNESIQSSDYYIYVSKLYLECGVLDLAIHFGKLALFHIKVESFFN